MKFKELDTVRVIRVSQENINIGDIGAIVMIFDNPEEAYEVEVMDEEGNIKVQATLGEEDLELYTF